MKEAIEARGCQLLFLPAYSPDFSPIEEAFSKLKTYLRRQGARTQALWETPARQCAKGNCSTLVKAQRAGNILGFEQRDELGHGEARLGDDAPKRSAF